jgi:hypothetical protein
MNKQGGVMVYGIMLAITIIVLALALAPAGRQFTDIAMNETVGDTIGLDCDNSNISNFNKATCIATDFSFFYFFTVLILIGGAVAVARIIF